MDPDLRNRLISGLACLGLLVVGWYSAGNVSANADKKIDGLLAKVSDPEKAQQEALQRDFAYDNSVDHFRISLAEDYEAFGLRPAPMDKLYGQQRFEHLVRDAKVLKPGKSFKSDLIKVTARVDKVKFNKGGATVTSKHSVAVVKNVSDKPVAYFARIHSASQGDCPVRGSQQHNAMGLMPGEEAIISVCAGTAGVRIVDLRALEISPIGYYYVSKIPPQAVGHDEITQTAHRGPRPAKMCTSMPAAKLSTAIRGGELAWQDVVDFYSRHNCDRLQMPDGYRLATNDLPSLPILDAAMAAGDEPAADADASSAEATTGEPPG